MNNYLYILWSNSRNQHESILSDMRKRFDYVKIYEFTWSKQHMESNFSRFYERRFGMKTIENLYGIEPFLVCIAESDIQNGDDASNRYLKQVNVLESIYAANDEKKVNRDVTLLFGKNLEEIKSESSWQSKEITAIMQDLAGAEGWTNLRELFHVLNNTISYCVWRNFEDYPDHFDPSIHDDVDLLVEDLKKAIWIANGHKMFPDKPTSVAYLVKFGGKEVQFDLRYVGDKYIDPMWEKNVLESATIPHDITTFRRMSPENQYYTLLYHVYVQKNMIAEDYPKKLKTFAQMAGLTYIEDIQTSVHQLEEYMYNNNYRFTIPTEYEATINWSNLKYTKSYYRMRLRYILERGISKKIKKLIRKINKIFS